MAEDRTCEDAMHTSLLGSPTSLSSNFGSPDGSVPDLDIVGVRSAGSIEERIEAILARKFSQIEASLASIPCSYKDSPGLKTVSCHSHNQGRPLQTKLQTLNKLLIASQLVMSLWKQVQPLFQAFPDQQDLGLHQDQVMALQPQGPMGQDHLTTSSATILVRQSKSPEDREIGRRFLSLWEVPALKLQDIFPEKDAKGALAVTALDIRAQVLSIHDRSNGVGKPVFKLAPLGHEQLFDVTAPNMCELYILGVVLHQIVSEASTPAQIREANVWWPPFRLAFSPLGESRPFFFLCGIVIWWPLLLVVYLCRRLSLHDQVPCFLGNPSNTMQPSRRHPDLLLPYRNLAWQMSIHIDTNTTLQRTRYGLLQSLPFLPLDLFARGTCVPRVAVGSTRRTRSSWSFTVARRCKLGSTWKRSSRSSRTTFFDWMLFNHQNMCPYYGWRL